MRFSLPKRPAQDTDNPPVCGGAALRLSQVSKSFGDTAAVASLSLELPAGQILCLLGPSGCGKTTTLRLIAGFEVPDSGSIRIGKRTVYGGGVNESPERRRIGMVFQEGALFPHLTVAQNVAFGLPRSRQRQERVADALRIVEMAGYDARYPYQLSGGQQQRVALARALAPSPDLILMDEPFSSLDPGLRSQLRDAVRAILKERHATVVCVTHDQEEAMLLGDTIAVMQAGRTEQIGSPEALFHHPDTQFAAEFFGTADFLPAWPDGAELATEIGRRPWPELWPTPGPAHRNLQVMVRPDCLDISADESGADESGGGVIARREFLGAFYLYVVALPSGRRVRVLKSHITHLEVGARVRVFVRAGHTLLPFSDGMALADQPAQFASPAAVGC